MRLDAVIVGAGPAGLSAALVLGRARRSVVLFDDGNYRNRDARRVHAFLTRDRETSPETLRALGRADLEMYSTVRIVRDTIIDVKRTADGFAALASSGDEIHSGAMLLATGFRDTLPAIAGARELHGDLVVPCPYCDAYEVRDQPLAAFSHPDSRGAEFANVLAQWSSDVIFCAERRPQVADDERARLAKKGVRIEHRELRSVEREGQGLRLVFVEGASVWRRMLFYHLGGGPASNLGTRLGAKLHSNGSVEVDRRQASSIPGLFVAGDATRDVLLAVVAAGEGSAAGVAINKFLCDRE